MDGLHGKVVSLLYVYIYLTLYIYSWGHHLHYDLEFRGFSVSDSRSFAWRHKADYCNFGVVAVALELIPLFNLIFMWTNVVGAALYVGDKYEKNEREIAKRNRHSTEGLVQYPSMPSSKNGYGSLRV